MKSKIAVIMSIYRNDRNNFVKLAVENPQSDVQGF